MGDVDAGDAQPLLDAPDLGAHLLAQLGVQVGERLVHQQHLGLHHQGAGQGHALLLPAGELVGGALLQAGQLHQLQHARHPLA